MLDLSIILPTCNRGPLLRECLECIPKNVGRSFEVVAVDGASTDDTAAVLEQARATLGDRLRIIREPNREGFTKACNKGFRAARGRYVTWINDDARPLPGSLDNAIVQLEQSPADVGLVAMFHHIDTERSIAYETWRHGKPFRLMHVRGTLYANFCVGRREMYERLGYFDERYFVKACDPDFSLKVWNAGLKIVPAFASLIDHDETHDDRRAADANFGREDNEKLFAKWELPPRNPDMNDFDPMRPCTLRGLRQAEEAA